MASFVVILMLKGRALATEKFAEKLRLAEWLIMNIMENEYG